MVVTCRSAYQIASRTRIGIGIQGFFSSPHILLYTGHKPMALVLDKSKIESLPITADPEIVSGTPVFSGTRVPIDALINNLENGLTLDEFLDNFPTVTREQPLQVLQRS